MKSFARWIMVLLITGAFAACSGNGPNKDPDIGGLPIPEAGLPDGFELHPCTTPGEACNAHNACAIDPICGKDLKCYPTRIQDCDDGLDCTVDVCKGKGLCTYEPHPGMCALPVKLEGETPKTVIQCFKTGDRNPADQCMVCNPETADGGSSAPGDPLHWTAANGGSCDDGDQCTKNDYCQAGVCRGDDFSKTCADGYGCTDDLCDGQGNCLGNKLRDDSCLINGECYKDGQQDEKGCNICDVKTSQNKWTPLSVFCSIGGYCYKPGTKDPTGCGICDPDTNDKEWTPIPGLCKIGNSCYTKGYKHPLGCAECDPDASTSAWTVIGDNCLVSDKCYKDGDLDPKTNCGECDPGKTKTDWTPVAGQCLIGTKCYATGTKNPSATCAECDAVENPNGWVVKGDECFISNKCYTPGATDTTQCGSCLPAQSKYAWTPVPNKCLIGATCYADGALDVTQCLTCNFASNPSGWTPVAGVTSTAYDFEGGQNPPVGWTIANSDPSVGWVVSSNRPGAGTYSLYYGNPTTKNFDNGGINSGKATMPAITLTAGKKAGLSFMLYMDTESGTSYDALQVYVGTTSLWSKTSTTVPKMEVWQEVTVDLSAYQGQTIEIRFEFDTEDSIGNSGEGVFLDNITIYHNC